jgi:subtilisin family serine protease
VRPQTAPDNNLGSWARGAVAPAGLGWPTSGAGPVAVVDDFVDNRPRDLAGQVTYLNATASSRLEGAHGTEVASAIGAQFNGGGLTGILPGVPIASWGVPAEAHCSDVAGATDAIRRAGLRIVNISLGGPADCFTLYIAMQRAFGAGLMVVASAGNDFQEGNPVIYPAGFPHVMSVAAVDPELRSADFSSANAAVDVSAPGVSVPLVTPIELDDDGVQDGFTLGDGTSFASPIVAGAAAWVRALRPGLTVGQLGDVLRYSARDLDREGYDSDTGWGLVDIAAALSAPKPPDDPGEPNDGVTMVDGTVFTRADRPVFGGSVARTVSAYADQAEDPLDVYRFRLRHDSRVRITLRARYGDTDLQVFDQDADTVNDTGDRVCRSVRGLHRADRCTVVWRGRGSRIGYAAVSVADSSDGIAARYALRFRRLR